ncbi:Hsp20/alpha crystallin family protein [Desulfoplanes sp.]
MSDLILWKNQEIRKIKEDMDELMTCFMDDFSSPFYLGMLKDQPRITTFESETSFIVKMEFPYVVPQSLEVNLVNHDLSIKGTQQDLRPNGRSPFVSQRTFATKVPLPGPVEEETISATYRDGILMVTLKKKVPPGPRKIDVTFAS